SHSKWWCQMLSAARRKVKQNEAAEVRLSCQIEGLQRDKQSKANGMRANKRSKRAQVEVTLKCETRTASARNATKCAHRSKLIDQSFGLRRKRERVLGTASFEHSHDEPASLASV